MQQRYRFIRGRRAARGLPDRTRFLALWLTGCAAGPSPASTPEGAPPPATEPAHSASAAPPALASAPAPGTRPHRSCGTLGCLLFDTPEAAFAHVLQAEPEVLAIGEAHPLRGAESVEPASRRFAKALLPLLRPRATDLVIELLLPNPACRKETVASARNEQKVVTERQADTAQNDFVALGHRAKAQRAQPHALKPTCEDLERIAAGGADAVVESLAVVTRLTEELVRTLLDARRRTTDKPLIVTYGGALHNDLAPRAGREQWSFGPALERLTSGRYVELDLIVPEFVKDSDAWRALPWYGAYDPEAHPTETTLFNPSPRSYVLIFPRSEARAGG